jgi:hypothetical protein
MLRKEKRRSWMEAPLFKVCSRCNVLKSHFEQSKRTATRHGVRTIFKTSCTDCTNHARVDRRRLHKIFTAPPPGAPCECCERVPQTLFLDHDHDTGNFRGWICRECNSGLGFFGDDLEGLRRAYEYLGG